jgi:hypothetical protein
VRLQASSPPEWVGLQPHSLRATVASRTPMGSYGARCQRQSRCEALAQVVIQSSSGRCTDGRVLPRSDAPRPVGWRRCPSQPRARSCSSARVSRTDRKFARLSAGGNRIRTISPAEKETAVERGPAADHRRLATPFSYRSGISRRQHPRDLSQERDRWFESGSLQRRVCKPSVPQRRSPLLRAAQMPARRKRPVSDRATPQTSGGWRRATDGVKYSG